MGAEPGPAVVRSPHPCFLKAVQCQPVRATEGAGGLSWACPMTAFDPPAGRGRKVERDACPSEFLKGLPRR